MEAQKVGIILAVIVGGIAVYYWWSTRKAASGSSSTPATGGSTGGSSGANTTKGSTGEPIAAQAKIGLFGACKENENCQSGMWCQPQAGGGSKCVAICKSDSQRRKAGTGLCLCSSDNECMPGQSCMSGVCKM